MPAPDPIQTQLTAARHTVPWGDRFQELWDAEGPFLFLPRLPDPLTWLPAIDPESEAVIQRCKAHHHPSGHVQVLVQSHVGPAGVQRLMDASFQDRWHSYWFLDPIDRAFHLGQINSALHGIGLPDPFA